MFTVALMDAIFLIPKLLTLFGLYMEIDGSVKMISGWFGVVCLYESMWSDSMQMLISGTAVEYQIAAGYFKFEGETVLNLILSSANSSVSHQRIRVDAAPPRRSVDNAFCDASRPAAPSRRPADKPRRRCGALPTTRGAAAALRLRRAASPWCD